MGTFETNIDSATVNARFDFLANGGEMGARMRAHDWAATPFGPLETWPQSLRSALSICLNSAFPSAVYWGPELRLLYNDAWAPIPGPRHPDALGKPAREVWADIWDVIGPQFARVLRGEGFATYDQYLPMQRYGNQEETYWNYSFTPIRGETGGVVGVFNSGNETTGKVLAERRLSILVNLIEALRDESDPNAVIATATRVIAKHLPDVRAGYAEIEASGALVINGGSWRKDETVIGRERFADFGADLRGALKGGRSLAVADVTHDAITAGGKAAFNALGIRAFLAAPIVQEGHFKAAFFVSSLQPRQWSQNDTRLIEEAAERVWNALELARSRAHIRESEARFRNMADNAPVMMWVTDASGSCTYLSRSWYSFTGQTPQTGLGFGWLDATHPDDLKPSKDIFLAANAIRESFALEYRLRRADGEYRWAIDSAAPRIGENGEFLGFIGSVIDITERKYTEEALRDSEERLRFALDAGQLGSWELDLSDRKLTTSTQCRAIFGRSGTDSLSYDELLEAVHPEDRKRMRAAVEDAIRTDSNYEIDYRIIWPNGEEHWVGVRGKLYGVEEGTPLRMVGISFDVTERKRAEEQQRLLVHEMHHRVKNNLATVQSIISFTLRMSDSMEAFHKSIAERISSLARTHSLLALEQWTGTDLRRLITMEIEPYDDGERVALNGPDIALTPDITSSLAMAIHELTTNAVKYGALSVAEGRLSINWSTEPAEESQRLYLEWIETGGPKVEKPARHGFGSTLLERLLARQLGGTVEISYPPEGIQVRITTLVADTVDGTDPQDSNSNADGTTRT